MNQSEFAELCGISRQMASKYAADGLIVRDADGEIDPEGSLYLLEGRLDDEKRLAALALLAGLPAPAPKPAPLRSPKAETDELKRQMLALQLAKQAGEVVAVAEVEELAHQAVADLRVALETARQPLVERLAAEFGVTADRIGAIARLIKANDAAALAAFATACAKLAGDAAPPQAAAG